MSQHRAFVAGVAAAAQSGDSATRNPAVAPCGVNKGDGHSRAGKPDEKGWIEVVVVDEEDRPVANVLCRITAPDGKVVEATTSGEGVLHVPAIPDGSCKIEFPDLDRRALEAA